MSLATDESEIIRAVGVDQHGKVTGISEMNRTYGITDMLFRKWMLKR